MPIALARTRSAGLVLLVALALVLAVAGRASADVTTQGPNGTTVTLGTDEPRPGQTISISGTGFVPAEAGSGRPHIAVKVDDIDVEGFEAGGTSRIEGDRSTALMWFIANADGTFSGTIKVPSNFTAPGPGIGANAGKHTFRILSGAYSDLGGPFSAGGPGTTVPTTFSAFFRVRPAVEVGASGFTTIAPDTESVFRPGTVLRRAAVPAPGQPEAGAAQSFASLRLTDAVPADATVAVRLGSTTLATAPVSPSARRRVRFAVPSATPLGAAVLTVTVNGVDESYDVRVVAPPTVALDTPSVRPGGLLAYRVTGFVGNDGTGQKVGVVVDRTVGGATQEATIDCIQTDANGAGSGVAATPDDLTTGARVVRFVVGTRCAGPTGRQDDLPASFTPAPLTASPTAPTASSATDVAAGSTAALTGAGFVAGQQVTVRLDGADTGLRLTVASDGTFSGTLPVSKDTTPGGHLLRFESPGATALARFTSKAAPATDPAAPTPDPLPTVPTTPSTPTAPTPTTPNPTPTKPVPSPTIKSLRVSGTKLRLNVGSILGRRTAITVKSAKKVRVGARTKAKIVTFATASTSRPGTLSVALTRDGRATLERLKKLTVVVRLAPKGGRVVTRRLTLRV